MVEDIKSLGKVHLGQPGEMCGRCSPRTLPFSEVQIAFSEAADSSGLQHAGLYWEEWPQPSRNDSWIPRAATAQGTMKETLDRDGKARQVGKAGKSQFSLKLVG